MFPSKLIWLSMRFCFENSLRYSPSNKYHALYRYVPECRKFIINWVSSSIDRVLKFIKPGTPGIGRIKNILIETGLNVMLGILPLNNFWRLGTLCHRAHI